MQGADAGAAAALMSGAAAGGQEIWQLLAQLPVELQRHILVLAVRAGYACLSRVVAITWLTAWPFLPSDPSHGSVAAGCVANHHNRPRHWPRQARSSKAQAGVPAEPRTQAGSADHAAISVAGLGGGAPPERCL